MMHGSSFLPHFTAEVCRSLLNDHRDNYDEDRFGKIPRPTPLRILKDVTKAAIWRTGYQNGSDISAEVQKAFDLVTPHLSELDRLFNRLADEESRTLLVKVMAFRALGHRRVKLPLSTPDRVEGIARMESLATPSDSVATDFMGWRLQMMDLASIGLPIKLYTSPASAFFQFVVEAYRCVCEPKTVEVAEGDYVLDAGGCWGDTALYFANRVGLHGRVFTFEFVPDNLRLLRTNLGINASLTERIDLVEHALWDRSGESMTYRAHGPGTKIGADDTAANRSVATMSIDDFVAERRLPRVDFIKMDIEGSELPALKGAERTLCRFKPKLAICVYHRLRDFFEIPDYLDSLPLGYQFYLRHFSIHAEETVLFASAS